jgi:hypothetical protein
MGQSRIVEFGPEISRLGHATENYGAICPAAGLSRFLQSRETYDNLVPELMRGGTVQLDPQDGFSDPLISQIALTIANELEDGCIDGIPADALNTTLALQIMRRLVDPSAMSDLAGVACLSQYHLTAPSRSRSALVRSAMSFSVGSSRRKL